MHCYNNKTQTQRIDTIMSYLTISISDLYCSSFTPITNMGASADGALMTTFLAPPVRCAFAFSHVVKIPVDSTTYSTPLAPHGKLLGSRLYNKKRSIALCVIIYTHIGHQVHPDSRNRLHNNTQCSRAYYQTLLMTS